VQESFSHATREPSLALLYSRQYLTPSARATLLFDVFAQAGGPRPSNVYVLALRAPRRLRDNLRLRHARACNFVYWSPKHTGYLKQSFIFMRLSLVASFDSAATSVERRRIDTSISARRCTLVREYLYDGPKHDD
jgi:hypothetical protein